MELSPRSDRRWHDGHPRSEVAPSVAVVRDDGGKSLNDLLRAASVQRSSRQFENMPIAKNVPSILFVCTGNICRSPTAQALLQHKAAEQGLQVIVDSAAISSGVLGQPPDKRTLAELNRRGVAMPVHHARLVTADDLRRFDFVLGMTRSHLQVLQQMAPAQAPVIDLLMRYADDHGTLDIPDPWTGGPQDFVAAFDMIEAGVSGLVRHLSK